MLEFKDSLVGAKIIKQKKGEKGIDSYEYTKGIAMEFFATVIVNGGTTSFGFS